MGRLHKTCSSAHLLKLSLHSGQQKLPWQTECKYFSQCHNFFLKVGCIYVIFKCLFSFGCKKTTRESLSDPYNINNHVSTETACEFSHYLSFQVALTCTQIWWTSGVCMEFVRLEGYDNALKEYYRKQVSQVYTLVSLLIGHLTPGDRQKVMTLCTIGVHARDMVANIIAQKAMVCGRPQSLTSGEEPELYKFLCRDYEC